MWTPYLGIKLLHVLLAIVAVGFSSTFGIIMATAAGRPGALPHALHFISRLEKIAGPCFGGLLVTGILMAWLGHVDWKQLWFVASLVIMGVAMPTALLVARPTLHRQLALIEQSPPPGDELGRLGARSRGAGIALSLMALTMIMLMVFKPTL